MAAIADGAVAAPPTGAEEEEQEAVVVAVAGEVADEAAQAPAPAANAAVATMVPITHEPVRTLL